MNYIENTYVCLAAPLLLAILCMRREGRRALAFVLSGMTACLLSAYVSSFAANAAGADLADAAYEISPAVEEIIKSLPLLFYFLVFEPDKRAVLNGAMLIAVGFATFENVCFLTSYGTADLLRLVMRGFGTGAMHVGCGVVLTCTEDVRFADDDPVGKGDVYIGFKLKGSSNKLYAHLTKLDGNQLVFTYQSEASDESIYDVVTIDLTAAPSGGMPLLSSTQTFALKQLNVRNAFTATKPSGADEIGITMSSSPITDMAGNPLIMESWMGDPSEIHRHFYIDGQKPFAVAADCSTVTNNADVKEARNMTDPSDPNYLDPSDLYLGVGDSLGLKVYMNEIVSYGDATIRATELDSVHFQEGKHNVYADPFVPVYEGMVGDQGPAEPRLFPPLWDRTPGRQSRRKHLTGQNPADPRPGRRWRRRWPPPAACGEGAPFLLKT